MDNCTFCKIIKGEIPSYTVYEDEKVKVFLDIDPSTDGHLLLIPKEHKETLFDMDNELLTYMLQLIKEKLYPLLKERLHIEGLTISQNNYLGQDVKHFHIHLTPRYESDGLKIHYDKSHLSKLEDVYEKLK